MHKNLPPLALERTSPNFHMPAWLVILCFQLKKDWSEHAKLLEPRPRLCVLCCAVVIVKYVKTAKAVLRTKSIGQAFKAAGWEVVFLNIVLKFKPRFCATSGAGTTRCFRRAL